MPQGPLSIYQTGQVAAPGISDLDFVLVFPDGKPMDWAQYQPQAFPQWVRELMTHPPYCCTESVWTDLSAWYPVFNLQHLWGDVLPEPFCPDKFIAGCALGMLIDYLIIKVPRDFIWIAWERPLRVRVLLAMLHSLKYTLKLAEQAGFDIREGDLQTVSSVDALRESWFGLVKLKRLKTLARLCEQVCDIAGELISRVDETILEGMKGCSENRNFTGVESNLFAFVSPWNYVQMMGKAFRHYAKSGKILWESPQSFLQVFAIYADACPKFARYLNSAGCRTHIKWDGGGWNEGLRYHAKAMLAYSESAIRIGVIPQKYVALGYRNPPPFWESARHHAVRFLKNRFKKWLHS
ncbi:hypothetical protein ACFL9U_01920 [Thermodesulfobacteriota bacterium]